jgi:small subunit ribosomal protein S18
MADENAPQHHTPSPATSGTTSGATGPAGGHTGGGSSGGPGGFSGGSGGMSGGPGGARPQSGGAGGRPGGPAKRGKRSFVRKKKVCRFCVDKVDYIDYKKAEILSPFIQDRGKILPRRMTGTCARHQRWLTVAIKRAQNIALLPFAAEL